MLIRIFKYHQTMRYESSLIINKPPDQEDDEELPVNDVYSFQEIIDNYYSKELIHRIFFLYDPDIQSKNIFFQIKLKKYQRNGSENIMI